MPKITLDISTEELADLIQALIDRGVDVPVETGQNSIEHVSETVVPVVRREGEEDADSSQG